MIEIRDQQYSYDQQKILSFPDWYISHGQNGVIFGDTGSGKTTLIGLISGLIQVQTGILNVCDANLKILTQREKDRFRRQNIGMVFHKPFLNNVLNVFDNLAFIHQLVGKPEDGNRIFELLHELNLLDKAYVRIKEIGRMEARLLAIARAILQNPRLILADEPTYGLDEKEGKQVFKVLIEQAQKLEASLVVATNDTRTRNLFQNQLNLKN